MYLCSAHLKPSNISTDDVGVSFVEIVEEKRQVRWVILTLTYLLLRRAISGKGVRTLWGSTSLNGVDLPNNFFFLKWNFKQFNRNQYRMKYVLSSYNQGVGDIWCACLSFLFTLQITLLRRREHEKQQLYLLTIEVCFCKNNFLMV